MDSSKFAKVLRKVASWIVVFTALMIAFVDNSGMALVILLTWIIMLMVYPID